MIGNFFQIRFITFDNLLQLEKKSTIFFTLHYTSFNTGVLQSDFFSQATQNKWNYEACFLWFTNPSRNYFAILFRDRSKIPSVNIQKAGKTIKINISHPSAMDTWSIMTEFVIRTLEPTVQDFPIMDFLMVALFWIEVESPIRQSLPI